MSFFLGSWGNGSERGTNKIVEPWFLDDLFLPCSDSFPNDPPPQKKNPINSLYLQCFKQRPFLKLSKKSYKMQNSSNNGHLTSLDALIIAHMIFPTAKLLVDWLSGIKSKISSRVQRRKYDTIVNIAP